jgi:hypothetical protein
MFIRFCGGSWGLGEFTTEARRHGGGRSQVPWCIGPWLHPVAEDAKRWAPLPSLRDSVPLSFLSPGLTPWAVFCRRFAAGVSWGLTRR